VLGKGDPEAKKELLARLERIDFILVSPELNKRCISAKVCNGKENYDLSDHYPVVAEFR
jgi:exonuclease III